MSNQTSGQELQQAPSGTPRALVRALELTAVALSFGTLALYLFFAVQRVGYPFELEWMEGGSLAHVMRVIEGEPLYVTPSLDFVPFPYPPFYYYAAAALSVVTGANFTTLRLVSLLSSLATALLIFRWVRREDAGPVLAIASAGVFLATWRASGLYFDVARLDSLFCFLLMLWLYGLRFHRTSRGLLLSAFAGFLAVMTKQTGAVVVASVALWCLRADFIGHGPRRVRDWRLTRDHLLPMAVLGLLGTVLLEAVIDENFLRHVVFAQQRHGIVSWKFGLFFGGDLVTTLPIACLVALGWLGVAARRHAGGAPERSGTQDAASELTASTGFHIAVLAGILLACLIPRVKVSGAVNNVIPMYAWLAVSFGVGLAGLRKTLRERWPGVDMNRVDPAIALCCSVQLLLLYETPRGYLPTAADRNGGERLVRQLRKVEGDVLIPGQGYLAGLAGKHVYAHQMPVSDYAKSGLPDAPALLAEYQRAVRERRFALIIDSNTSFVRRYVGDDLLAENYEMAGWAFPDASVFVPISGAQIRPGKLWVRRQNVDARSLGDAVNAPL